VSATFDLVVEGEPTEIARDKDKMIGDAVLGGTLEETDQKVKPRRE
jgi:hypothetical protein